MRLISETLRKLRIYEKEYRKGTLGRMIEETEEVLKEAADAIEMLLAKLEARVQNGEWIPCSERLPGAAGFYLVTKKQRSGEIQVALGCYQPLFKSWSGNGNFKEVLAWMPLPERYTERMMNLEKIDEK